MRNFIVALLLLVSTLAHADLTPIFAGSGAVDSVNTQTGVVVLDTDEIAEGSTNKYFANSLARLALSATAPMAYNNSTGVISLPVSGTAANGYLSSTDWNIFNDKQDALASTDDLVEGSTNKYFAASLAKAAAVADAINDSTTDVAPSQNAVFDALALKLSSVVRSNIIYVEKSGSDSTCVANDMAKPCLTITKALTLVTSPVTTNRWIIQLGAGTFTEATLDLTRWTYIRGAFASMQGGASRIIVTAGSIGVTSDWNISATRGGLMDLYLSGSTGLNIDLQTVGGSSSEVFEVTNVGMNGGIVFKGKNSLDYIQTNDVGVFGASTISGGSPTLQGTLFFSSLTVNTSGSADAYATMVNSAVFGNASFTSSGSNTTVVTANACTFLGTVTVDDSDTTFLHDAVSAPQASADLIVTNSGVVEQATRAHTIGYVPGVSGNWLTTAPVTVQEALDKIATGKFSSQGVQLATSGSQPTCDVDHRGLVWNLEGGAGVADILQVCQKDAADAYGWASY